MARGGRRSGAPNTAYPNRTDLQVPGQTKPPTQPIQTPPSAQYGQSTKLAQAQKVIPLPAQAGPPGGATPPPGPPPPAMPTPPGGPAPGELPPLVAPTQRPGEPVTHGAVLGPGAGPEALNAGGPSPLVSAAALLNRTDLSGNPVLRRLSAQLQAHLTNQNTP